MRQALEAIYHLSEHGIWKRVFVVHKKTDANDTLVMQSKMVVSKKELSLQGFQPPKV